MSGPRIPENIAAFMREFGVAQDEIWLVPGGKSYAIKHSALDRIAVEKGVWFDPPQIVESNGAEGIATIVVTGHMGDAHTWSFGEASPKNNKNAYPFAMAEKRAKDRCLLKLLSSHGAIFSEEEAEDFREPSGKQQEPAQKPESLSQYIARFKQKLAECKTRDDVAPLWKAEAEARKFLNIPDASITYQELYLAWTARGKEISAGSHIKVDAA